MTAQHQVEIYEEPGLLEDGFRANWVNHDGIGTFANCGSIAGDYARQTVTDPISSYRVKRENLDLSTDTYRVLRVRVRGGGTGDAQFQISFYETGYGVFGATGWQDPTSDFKEYMFEIPSGRTINTIYLWVRDQNLSQSCYIDWDYVAILKHPPFIPEEIEELEVDLQTTVGVSGYRFTLLNDPLFGVTVLRLPFNENFGLRAYDLSRYKHVGDITDATWVDSLATEFRKALSFNGTSTFLQIPDHSSLDITDKFAIELLIKINAFPSVYAPIILKSDSGYVQYWNYGLILYSDGDLSFAIGNGSTYNLLTDQVYLQTGRWYHIVAVLTDSHLKLYVNGEEKGSISRTIDPAPNAVDLFFAKQGARYLNCVIDEPRIYTRNLKSEEIYQRYVSHPLSGAVRAGVGDIAMIYLAGDGESLDEKLIKGRIIDREMRGEPDNPIIEIIGEAIGELLLERTYTDEFATATQISEIVKDTVDDALPEFTRASVDTTNLAIKNVFDEERVHDLLKKLAETAQYGDGTWGGNFWVDPGGDLHFEKLGKWSGPDLTDGSDDGTPNILDIAVKETMKGNPRLVNDLKLVIFEEEHIPKDEDSWTEPADAWSSPDPTDAGSPSSDTGDVKSGTACIKFNTTNPGSQYRMRLVFSEEDIAGFDKIKFWFKYGSGLSPENLEVKIQKGSWTWTWDYRIKSGISLGSSETWQEIEVNISDMSVTGHPGNKVDHLQIRAYRSAGDLGTGGFKIDKLRFIRSEKAKTAEDSTSISKYGRRKETVIDKTITDEDYAQYLGNGMLKHRKNPTVHIRAKVKGKAQLGWRPPQKVKVTSLKDALDGAYFQISSAKHQLTTKDRYLCDLNLIAAREPTGIYEPKIVPPDEPSNLGGWLAVLKFLVKIMGLSSLRREWK